LLLCSELRLAGGLKGSLCRRGYKRRQSPWKLISMVSEITLAGLSKQTQITNFYKSSRIWDASCREHSGKSYLSLHYFTFYIICSGRNLGRSGSAAHSSTLWSYGADLGIDGDTSTCAWTNKYIFNCGIVWRLSDFRYNKYSEKNIKPSSCNVSTL